MRVLHLGKFYPPAKGGMEAILRLICHETANHVQNRVLVANDRFVRVEERDGSVEVVRLPSIARIGAVAVCPAFPAQLAREEADLIVLHEPNPMALVAYFLARPEATAHRLVSQRGHPPELAVPAFLSSVSAVRADVRHAYRRIVRTAVGDGARSCRSGRTSAS